MYGNRPTPSFVPHSRDQRESRDGLLMSASHLAQLENIGQQRTKDVRPGTELRITVAPEGDLYLRAHSRIPDTFATAEIFGMELVMGHEYKIQRGTSIAIYSWHGCTIEMRGPTTMEYDASNHVMKEYVNLAGIVEQKRQRAEELGTAPPRVLITGSENSGKSTMALFLSNYALRKHRRPICVELDAGSLSYHRQLPSIPGCVSAVHVDHSAYELNQEPVHPNRISLHKGIDQGQPAPHLNPNYPHGKSVWFYYGFEDWRVQPAIYWKCISQLACLVAAKEEVTEATLAIEKATNSAVQAEGVKLENWSKGGIIVNAPSNPSNQLIDEIVRLYNINSIVVIEDDEKFQHCIDKFCGGKLPSGSSGGDELLDSGSKNALVYLDAIENQDDDECSGQKVDVCHVARAGGVLSIKENRSHQFHVKFADYFHGPERDLICHNVIVPLRELFICGITVRAPAESVGSVHWGSRFAVQPFQDVPGKLRHSVLAVVLAPSIEEVVFSTITGLVWVREVSEPEDPINAQLHLMCPSPGPLMSNYLVFGDIDNLKYFEQ
jgi:hypothetical protein